MAFEAYLSQGKSKPRKARWLTGTLSLTFHGTLLLVALVYSFWHVDELSPPTVTVTFLSAPPPPPPPPPAKKKSTQAKTKPTHEIVQPRTNQLVQPKQKEEPKEEPKDDGEEGGVEGGVAGGVAGGTAGAVPAAVAKVESTAPRMISPGIGALQILTDPVKDPRYRVKIPEQLNRPGVKMFALIKICVSKEGNVVDVKMVKGMDPSVDPVLKQTALAWKYKPLTIDDHPVPFCYNLRYDHQVQ